MLRAYLKRLLHKLDASVAAAVARIDHNAVIKDLVARADLSGSYLLMIVFSCLVALLGLLTNSVAVVIGAMLISPLMGPIFTAALAFTLGDLHLARKVLRIIVISILLSVLVTTLFTFLSPLKAPTQEILSRTRPNIYDLLIAAFAGAAGAYALCTRVSYLFVTTGVAVATAVIPPLSVVGYGIATGQGAIALGGFLLFFTNLVAIVISSDIVFHLFRFRARMVEESRYPVRTRVLILAVVLVLISIPLVYTLVKEISNVNLTSHIEQTLKKRLNNKENSRMTGFSFQKDSNGMTVAASVNTVAYFNYSTEKRIEGDLKATLKTTVNFALEQTIVRSGRISAPSSRLLTVAPAPAPETLSMLRSKVMRRMDEGCRDLEVFVAPYPIRGCGVRFSDRGDTITALVTIGRDYPASAQELRWMTVALTDKLDEPVTAEVTTVPFLPPVTLGPDGLPDDASRKALTVLKTMGKEGQKQHFVIVAPKKTGRVDSARALRRYLLKELSIPAASIAKSTEHGNELRVKIVEN